MNHSFSRGFCPDGGQGDLNAKTQRREAAKSFFRFGVFAALRLCVERSFIRAIREIRGSFPLVAAGRGVNLGSRLWIAPDCENLHFGLDWRGPSMQSQGVKKRLVMPPAKW